MHSLTAALHSPRLIKLLLIPALVVVAIFFVYPCITLVLASFGVPEWSLDGYMKDLLDPTIATVMIRTFLISAVVTICALIVAFPYAYLMTQVSVRTRVLMLAIVLIPFWTSLLARTFAWMVLFEANGPLQKALAFIGIQSEPLIGTSLGVMISMVQILLPFMILPLYSSLAGIDANLLRASSSLGANGPQTFVKVYAPLATSGVAAGSLLVFIMSLGFYITPRMIGSPQQAMIGQIIAMRVEQFLDFSGAGVLSVLLLLAFVVTMLCFAIIRGIARRISPRWT